jgi:hypothetical protein
MGRQEVFCYMSDTLPCAQFYDPSVLQGRRDTRGGWGLWSWLGLLLATAVSVTCACSLRSPSDPDAYDLRIAKQAVKHGYVALESGAALRQLVASQSTACLGTPSRACEHAR